MFYAKVALRLETLIFKTLLSLGSKVGPTPGNGLSAMRVLRLHFFSMSFLVLNSWMQCCLLQVFHSICKHWTLEIQPKKNIGHGIEKKKVVFHIQSDITRRGMHLGDLHALYVARIRAPQSLRGVGAVRGPGARTALTRSACMIRVWALAQLSIYKALSLNRLGSQVVVVLLFYPC